MRPAVLTRKISQQNRSEDGAKAHAILMTLFRSAELQGFNRAYPVACQTRQDGGCVSSMPRQGKDASRHRVYPLAAVQSIVGRGYGVRRESQDRVECRHRVEAPIEPEDILVEIGL